MYCRWQPVRPSSCESCWAAVSTSAVRSISYLLDQDEAAHETAHRRLSRILLEQHKGRLPVTLECLHFSVRQLMLPANKEERAVRDELLSGSISCTQRDSTTTLPSALLAASPSSSTRSCARVVVFWWAISTEIPDSTWVMEFVVGWHLVYRTHESMMRLGRALNPAPAQMGITRDATGHCLFLDVVRPG